MTTDQELGRAIRIVFSALAPGIDSTLAALNTLLARTPPDLQPANVVRPPVHDWMLVAEVAEYARCGRTEVLSALNDGTLHGHQIKRSGKWRIHREDVDAWLRGNANEARR